MYSSAGAGASLAEAHSGTVLTRHTVALDGISPCVNEIVTDYLIDLELPAEGDRCVL